MKLSKKNLAARVKVKAWPEVRKNRVRSVCEEVQRLNAEGSMQERVRSNADFSFVRNECFPKNVVIDVVEILELL